MFIEKDTSVSMDTLQQRETEDPGGPNPWTAATQDFAHLPHMRHLQGHYPEGGGGSKVQLPLLQVCWMQDQDELEVFDCFLNEKDFSK